MKYSETETNKLLESEHLNLDDQIKTNILNFIRVIHLNNQDFMASKYKTEYFGDLPMTFQRQEGQVIGLITATVKGEVRKYVFNENGYESLSGLLELIE